MHDKVCLILILLKIKVENSNIDFITLLLSFEPIDPKVNSESIFFLKNAKIVAAADEFSSVVTLYANYLPLSFSQIYFEYSSYALCFFVKILVILNAKYF